MVPTAPRRLARLQLGGAGPVALGAVVSGAAAYAFLVMTARTLGPHRDAALAALWSLAYLAGPGFFLPIEQETTRLVAQRRPGPREKRTAVGAATRTGAVLLVLLVGASLAVAGPATAHLFDGQDLLALGFLLVLPGYLAMHITWGLLAGTGRFGPYSRVTAGEGLSRLAIGALLVAVGVRTAGPYGLAIGLAPGCAALWGLIGQRGLADLAPTVDQRALTAAVGRLLGGSFLNQFLLMAGPVAVKLLARQGNTATARFLAGMVVVRVPLFLFNAVLAALLPHLSHLVADRRVDELRRVVRRSSTGVACVGAAITLLAAAVGPRVMVVLFGPSYRLGAGDLTVLSAACGSYMLALTLGLALIAFGAHGRTTVGWAAGTIAFVATVLCGGSLGLLGRVEYGFLAGCVAAAATMAALLAPLVRGWSRRAPAIEPAPPRPHPVGVGSN